MFLQHSRLQSWETSQGTLKHPYRIAERIQSNSECKTLSRLHDEWKIISNWQQWLMLFLIATIPYTFPYQYPKSIDYSNDYNKALAKSTGQISDFCCRDIKKSGPFHKWLFICESLQLVGIISSSLSAKHVHELSVYKNESTSVIMLSMVIIIE